MSFWLVPSGSDEPAVSATAWDLTISPETKPFYFFADGDSICFYPTVDKYIKELLDANPKLRVNVVLNGGTRRESVRLRQDIVKAYGREYSKRFRFFLVGDTGSECQREYWLVPH